MYWKFFKKTDTNFTMERVKKLNFKYVDSDNDHISFTIKEEWGDVIDSFNGSLLKIYITISEESKEKINSDIQNLFNSFNKNDNNKEEKENKENINVEDSEKTNNEKGTEKINVLEMFKNYKPLLKNFLNENKLNDIENNLNDQNSNLNEKINSFLSNNKNIDVPNILKMFGGENANFQNIFNLMNNFGINNQNNKNHEDYNVNNNGSNFLKNFNNEKKIEENVHYYISCVGCSKTPVGIRFKCEDCENFNLCETCYVLYGKNHPEEHLIIQIVKPENIKPKYEEKNEIKEIKEESIKYQEQKKNSKINGLFG